MVTQQSDTQRAIQWLTHDLRALRDSIPAFEMPCQRTSLTVIAIIALLCDLPPAEQAKAATMLKSVL